MCVVGSGSSAFVAAGAAPQKMADPLDGPDPVQVAASRQLAEAPTAGRQILPDVVSKSTLLI